MASSFYICQFGLDMQMKFVNAVPCRSKGLFWHWGLDTDACEATAHVLISDDCAVSAIDTA